MSGTTDLSDTLKSLEISCDDVAYSFSVIADPTKAVPPGALGTFLEDEGLTVIASVAYLRKHNLPFEGSYAKLTMEVHTSLELVGFTAVLAKTLTDNGISANVVAAYYHDHVFVAYDVRQAAINALTALK